MKTKILVDFQICIRVPLKKTHGFCFSKNINDSIHRFLKNAVCIKYFSINYSDTTQ